MNTDPKSRWDKNPGVGSFALLICVIVFAAVFIVYTAQYLPDPVATHFAADNHADGWMSRSEYLVFMLSFMIGISGVVSVVLGLLPVRFPRWTNVPHRDYWLAPERREESLCYLSSHGKRLGYLIVMMMLGMHYTILLANHMRPPVLPVPTFTSISIGFALALLWWIVRLYRRFPKRSGPSDGM